MTGGKKESTKQTLELGIKCDGGEIEAMVIQRIKN